MIPIPPTRSEIPAIAPITMSKRRGAVTAVQRTSSDLRLNPLLAGIDTAKVSR
jgi:hypothetical protein